MLTAGETRIDCAGLLDEPGVGSEWLATGYQPRSSRLVVVEQTQRRHAIVRVRRVLENAAVAWDC